jgi:hypothetical protein
MLVIHPFLAWLVVLFIFIVAALGWRYRLTRAPGSGASHQRAGKVMLVALALITALGVGSVIVANLAGIKPGNSGHFVTAIVLLVGYTLSAILMFRWGKQRWVRRLHVGANTALLIVVVLQILAGTNRLYKFNLLAPIPQDQTTRALLAIKFGLDAPPATATRGQTYAWTAPNQGRAVGGVWRVDADSILQADCGCSGNLVWDTLTINNRFPLLVFEDPVFRDAEYSAEFNIEMGQVDQYAGLAFRIVNEDNYYIARASASEQSVSLARFDNGARQVLMTTPAQVSLNQWQHLQVGLVGSKIKIFLNDQLLNAVRDEGWLSGRVGLGTKADSITRFRRISVKAN